MRGDGASDADAYAYAQKLKMYYLSEMPQPEPTRFVDGSQYPFYSLPFYDIRALQDIYEIVSVEPVRKHDQVMMGKLATLGIERDKPFNPPERLKAAMERGVVDAYYYVHDLVLKLHKSNLYWADRHWSFVMVPDKKGGFDFVTDSVVEIDRRAAAWQFFTFYPKMLSEHPATVYLAPIADSKGRVLEAGKIYKLRIPKDVPAKQFWSLTVYDEATWVFLDNPLGRSGLGSFNKDQLKINSDGSVDLYFGPKAPNNLESNWIPTMDKKPYIWLRLYGPDTAFGEKTFKMPDVERID